MAKFILLCAIGMCSTHFMKIFCFLGGNAFSLTQNSLNVPAVSSLPLTLGLYCIFKVKIARTYLVINSTLLPYAYTVF